MVSDIICVENHFDPFFLYTQHNIGNMELVDPVGNFSGSNSLEYIYLDHPDQKILGSE